MDSPKAVLKTFSLRDIAPTFNLIQDGCRRGHFTALYLRPRFMAGLGVQLFTLLLKCIRLSDRICYPTHAHVLMIDGVFAGFIIIRHMPTESEIYMCSLLPEFRGKGFGRLMLAEAIAACVPKGRRLVADCLPASKEMMSTLAGLGFFGEQPNHCAAARRYILTQPES